MKIDMSTWFLFQKTKYFIFFKFNSIWSCLKNKLKYIYIYILTNLDSLINIMESPQNLFTHLSLNEDPYLKKELLLELAKQYVSFKEFSEKINLLHFEMLSLMQEENLPDFLSKANNKIADIFNANIARVWIYDVV